jgi:glycosyltransferase involved in cell wall biosynthesis
MPTPGTVVFVTTPHLDPWSGAEVLWSETALAIRRKSIPVAAIVSDGSLQHPRIRELQAQGVALWPRPAWYSLRRQPLQRLRSRSAAPVAYTLRRLLEARTPQLVVLSDGKELPPNALLDLCIARRVPFVTLSHSNADSIWYPDDRAERYRTALASALRCFFVSDANRRLAEKQIGAALPNAETVWNPFNVRFDADLRWPDIDDDGGVRFACVGSLFPPSKGQDILLEALARPEWRTRPWRLFLYGEGSMREGIARLARTLEISDRVVFAGHVSPEQIWADNHVLVVPSRYEGGPMVTVEAMLCGRPVVATDVGRHAEIIEDGVTGFLVEAATPHAMAAALERFWERRVDAQAMGKAGRRKIRELVPSDPVRVFAEKLMGLVGLGDAH